MRDEVTVHMKAAPERIWAVISDVTRTPEFSPEVFESEWLGGADGPALGVRFRGHVRRNEKGPVYWTTCRITHCEPGRDFGFAVMAGANRTINNWRYQLAARDGGTDVTESFAMTPSLATRVYWLALGWARGRRNRDDMRRTLERIRTVVEAD